ncbi:alpha-amylase A-like [Phlebotomus argentipes]|uniref:alpha-amylase A-like n=1 Tax=Phlebotomus argentipes TaxID=94469 RepID=UPI0028934290|nr:alpha-amylase A-like [Phlebotomus argentipes]
MNYNLCFVILLVVWTNDQVEGQFNPHFFPGRSVIVHLFEWKFSDIATECEEYLGPNSFGGVQVSPVSECVISPKRAWWERYQPVSYAIISRSGDELDFADMVKRCNEAGIRVYVDVVFNHMAGGEGEVIGVGGSIVSPQERLYPHVPYGPDDFNSPCLIENYQNAKEIRDCSLLNLPDLNQKLSDVRANMIEFLDRLIDFGVAGFRADAAKHMWPDDIKYIFGNTKNLNKKFSFPDNARPFLYQEVIDMGNEPISKNEYTTNGVITEFLSSAEIGNIFRHKKLKELIKWGTDERFLRSDRALVFVENHDNERGHGAGGKDILTYKDGKRYLMAVLFILAHPYGISRIMSSYDFSNSDEGPPMSAEEEILSPIFNERGLCINSWICQHRWPGVAGMVQFRNAVAGSGIVNWADNGEHQIAFCRGELGFVAFNGYTMSNLNSTVKVCLPPGIYCDVISGEVALDGCTGLEVVVKDSGYANIFIPGDSPTGALAIHWGSLYLAK